MTIEFETISVGTRFVFHKPVDLTILNIDEFDSSTNPNGADDNTLRFDTQDVYIVTKVSKKGKTCRFTDNTYRQSYKVRVKDLLAASAELGDRCEKQVAKSHAENIKVALERRKMGQPEVNWRVLLRAHVTDTGFVQIAMEECARFIAHEAGEFFQPNMTAEQDELLDNLAAEYRKNLREERKG